MSVKTAEPGLVDLAQASLTLPGQCSKIPEDAHFTPYNVVKSSTEVDLRQFARDQQFPANSSLLKLGAIMLAVGSLTMQTGHLGAANITYAWDIKDTIPPEGFHLWVGRQDFDIQYRFVVTYSGPSTNTNITCTISNVPPGTFLAARVTCFRDGAESTPSNLCEHTVPLASTNLPPGPIRRDFPVTPATNSPYSFTANFADVSNLYTNPPPATNIVSNPPTTNTIPELPLAVSISTSAEGVLVTVRGTEGKRVIVERSEDTQTWMPYTEGLLKDGTYSFVSPAIANREFFRARKAD